MLTWKSPLKILDTPLQLTANGKAMGHIHSHDKLKSQFGNDADMVIIYLRILHTLAFSTMTVGSIARSYDLSFISSTELCASSIIVWTTSLVEL